MKNNVIFSVLTQDVLALPFYITHTCLRYTQFTPCSKPEGTDHYQISYCLSGKGQFTSGDYTCELTPGDAFLLAPGTPVYYESAAKEPWVFSLINYNGPCLNALFQEGYSILKNADLIKLRNNLPLIEQLISSALISSSYQASVLLYEILCDLVAMKLNTKTSSNKITHQLEEVIHYMEGNLGSTISSDLLAKQIDVSVSYLCRIFSSVYKMSPVQYLIELRMNHAKKLLVTQPDQSIRQISVLCGYNEPSYFCYQFKKSTGTTPAQYRRQHR